ncbi:MAG: MFS transporter, partial [Staphylococcus equorum]|nr:MFS transporter [Staphylococcus equorum]
FVAVAFFNCTNYMVTSYMPSYLQQIVKLDSTTVSVVITLVMAVMIPLALMFGRIADKIGEKKVFLIGLIGTAVLSIFAFSLFQSTSIIYVIVGIFILGFFLSTYEATMPGSLPTMFYTHIRYRTLAVTFNVSVSLFGGTTPLIASALVAKTGDPLSPAYYLTAMSIVGIIVISLLHVSTSGKSLKGSYPNVESDEEYEYYAENPEKAMWWAKNKRV